MTETTQESGPRSKKLSDKEKLDRLVRGADMEGKKVAVFTHSIPDPDAIGGAVGFAFLINNVYGMDVDCFYDGQISHPQNKAMVSLLDPHLLPCSQYKEADYGLRVLVDSVPENAGTSGHDVKFDLVIDHHKDLPSSDYRGKLIHSHSGSTCGIVHDLIEKFELQFDPENEIHNKVATSLFVGVVTDTNHCMSIDTTTKDFRTMEHLFRSVDLDALRKIVAYNRPMSWVKLTGIAINEHIIEDGVAATGLGTLLEDQKDVIADVAAYMLTWTNVQTAVVFALFEGQTLKGSIRTCDDTLEVNSICKLLGGKHGHGGGKNGAGGYSKPLGAMEIDLDEDDDLKESMWDVIKKREFAKIFKTLNK